MSGALEPVEDVGAAGVVNLVKRVSVRLLNGDGVTAKNTVDYLENKPSRSRNTRRFVDNESQTIIRSVKL